MNAAEHHVLHAHGKLAADVMHHLRLDRRVRRVEWREQGPVARHQVADRGGLGAVMPEQVIRGLDREAEVERGLPEIGRASCRERVCNDV